LIQNASIYVATEIERDQDILAQNGVWFPEVLEEMLSLIFMIMVFRLEQAGCSSSMQEFATYSHRSTLGDGVHKNRERRVQIRAGKGPPKQGRGYNSKKAAADGIRKIMRGREADGAADGWTQVSTGLLAFFSFPVAGLALIPI